MKFKVRGNKKEIRSALRESLLAPPKRGPQKDRVHDLRVKLKRARAVLRLLEQAGMPGARTRLAASRKARHELAPIRSQQILAAMIQKYSPGLKPEHPKPGGSALLKKVDRTLQQLSPPETQLDRATFKPKTLSAGLRKSVKRGAKAMKRSAKSGKPADFHLLRRRVKDLLYQLEVLQSMTAGASKKVIRCLNEIADLTGDAHDIIELERWLQRNGGGVRPRETLALRKRLESEAAALNRKALQRSRKIFC